jgi:hypothetical protein
VITTATNTVTATVGVGDDPFGVAIGTAAPQCQASTSNAQGFNGTPIIAGSYIWFNAHFQANGVPSTGTTTVFFQNSIITINGTPYPTPNATIIFSPSYSCLSTTFENGQFVTTSPTGGSDEIWLTGLSFPVPSGFNAASANVNWSGTFGTDTPGVTMQWQWGAAVYTSCFTTDYTAINPLAAHGNACGYSGGDHAGTPEGVSGNGTPFKQCVTGGATGGGGGNYTGSWSGTANVTPSCASM